MQLTVLLHFKQVILALSLSLSLSVSLSLTHTHTHTYTYTHRRCWPFLCLPLPPPRTWPPCIALPQLPYEMAGASLIMAAMPMMTCSRLLLKWLGNPEPVRGLKEGGWETVRGVGGRGVRGGARAQQAHLGIGVCWCWRLRMRCW